MKKSKFFKINGSDIIRGIIITVTASLLGSLITILETGELNNEKLKLAGISAIISGISYISKNLLTNSNDEFLRREYEDNK